LPNNNESAIVALQLHFPKYFGTKQGPDLRGEEAGLYVSDEHHMEDKSAAGRMGRDSRNEAAKQVKLIYIQEISMDRTTTRSCARRAGLYIDHPESLTADNSTGDAGLPDRGSVGTKLLGTERASDYFFFRPRSNKPVFH
jgi:hypothetical protein